MTNGKAGGLARREKSGMVMAFGDGVVYREHGYAREEKKHADSPGMELGTGAGRAGLPSRERVRDILFLDQGLRRGSHAPRKAFALSLFLVTASIDDHA